MTTAWANHDMETDRRRRRISQSQPLQWAVVKAYLLLPIYLVWGAYLLVQGWLLLGEEDRDY